jgi:hypothetical protein
MKSFRKKIESLTKAHDIAHKGMARMEQKTLQLIAKLRRLAGKHGKPFDVLRFSQDSEYAKTTLSDLVDTEDEELILVGLSLQQAMSSSTSSKVEEVRVAAPPAPAAAPAPGVRSYVGRLR